MKACTLCLQTNTNVCQLGDSAAINFIQEIFVNNGFQELSGHNYICLLCNYLLNKSYNFIQRTLRAQKALKDIVDEGTKITVSTLRQIDRHKLDLDVNLICQEIEINHHIWDSNNNEDNSSAIINPLENITDFNNAFIKNEDNTFGNNTIFPPDYYYNHNYEDVNYNDGYVPNKLDSLDVKTEDITSHVEIKVDIEPYFADIPLIHTRRGRKHVNYEEVTNDCKVKNKNKKAKVIKCEPKEEPDEDGNVKIKPKRQKIKKTGKRERKLKRVDNRKYPMKCDHCRYMIQNKTEHFHHYLLYHQGIQYPYRREGKFMCQHCGIVKTTAHVLHEHELTHGEKKVSCQQCGKLFHNETRLKRHLKRHGAVLKVCDYCNKGFVAREDLILHIRTHTGVKPFKCGLRVRDGKLRMRPVTLESVYGADYVRQALDLTQRCTGMVGSEDCSREASGPQILPPVITAKVTTKNTFAFKYGRVEVSAKFPLGDWIVPLIQLEPRDHIYGTRNYASGLLRIACAKGNAAHSKKLLGGPIMCDRNPYRTKHLKEKIGFDNWAKEFHNYTLEWRPDGISVYVDGTQYGDVVPGEGFAEEAKQYNITTASQWLKGTIMAPFDEMFYIAVGLNVGGVNEFPDDSSKPWTDRASKAVLNFWTARDQWLPTWFQDTSLLEVDYVKVYAL